MPMGLELLVMWMLGGQKVEGGRQRERARGGFEKALQYYWTDSRNNIEVHGDVMSLGGHLVRTLQATSRTTGANRSARLWPAGS